MQQFRNFIPNAWTTIISGHAQNQIQELADKVTADEDFVDKEFAPDSIALFGRDYELLEGEFKDQREAALKEIKDKVFYIDLALR
jgi:hypothetical protein